MRTFVLSMNLWNDKLSLFISKLMSSSLFYYHNVAAVHVSSCSFLIWLSYCLSCFHWIWACTTQPRVWTHNYYATKFTSQCFNCYSFKINTKLEALNLMFNVLIACVAAAVMLDCCFFFFFFLLLLLTCFFIY